MTTEFNVTEAIQPAQATTGSTGSFSAAFLLLGGLTVTSVAGIILFQHPDAEIRAQAVSSGTGSAPI